MRATIVLLSLGVRGRFSSAFSLTMGPAVGRRNSGLVGEYLKHSPELHTFSEEEVALIGHKLTQWYDKERRKLPWRGDDPPWTRSKDAAAKDAAAAAPATGGGGKKKGKAAAVIAAAAKDTQQGRISSFFKPGPPAAGKTESMAIEIDDEESGEVGATGLSMTSTSSTADTAAAIPRSPYGTWVSEIMLQQTRVETVIDYFQRWMRRFPTVQALAEAELDDVNAMWAGLGYYRRAKMLHNGAKTVVSDFGGKLPSTVIELKRIPGIGAYTAGAVSSIAFGQVEALVDGNVIRVLSRLRAVGSDPKQSDLNALCWEMARSLVDKQRPGDFNQALMELGATLCTVKSPNCSACPIKEHCLALRLVSDGGSSTEKNNSKKEQGGGVSSNGNAEEDGDKEEEEDSDDDSSSSRSTCTVCDVEECGNALLPEAVTDFPRKAARKPPTPQLLTVSVVERSRGGSSAPKFLVMKRPQGGLLEGQWECPALVLDDGTGSTGSSSTVSSKAKVKVKATKGKPIKKGAGGGKGTKKLKAQQQKDAGSGQEGGEEEEEEDEEGGEEEEEERRRKRHAFLQEEVGLSLDPSDVDKRQDVGVLVHVFSHLRHTMHVEWIRLMSTPTSDPEGQGEGGQREEVEEVWRSVSGRDMRWMDETELRAVGVTTGMKKVFALIEKAREAERGTRDKKPAKAKPKRRAGSSASTSSSSSSSSAATAKRTKR